MAGERPVVFADTNVLYSAALRDILIELALLDALRLHWSPKVLDELTASLRARRPAIAEASIGRLLDAMNQALPDALVSPGDRQLLATLPDPGDCHVLAAALEAGCNTLLTFNLADFPAVQLAREDAIAAMHPDVFLLNQLTSHAIPLLTVIRQIQAGLSKPPISLSAYLDNLQRSGLPQTAALLCHLLHV
jgi:predicted nucleic acid-binding protein